ncbi:MAG: hypothetical protein ABI389_02395 [Rhodanobacter sp.]
MCEHQRRRVRVDAFGMQVVDNLAIDVARELRHCVESALDRAPIKSVAPMVNDIAQNDERHSGVPGAAADVDGPTSSIETAMEFSDCRIGDVDAERRSVHLAGLDSGVGGSKATSSVVALIL